MKRGHADAGPKHQGFLDVACSGVSHLPALANSLKTKVRLVEDALRQVQLRPTCHRVALALLLMNMRDQELCADAIYEASYRMQWQLPRSTVIASLRRFAQAGLLQRVKTANSRKLWFSVGPEFVRRFAQVASK
jgi:Fe2+ or Zn2+ uptake regulation protein